MAANSVSPAVCLAVCGVVTVSDVTSAAQTVVPAAAVKATPGPLSFVRSLAVMPVTLRKLDPPLRFLTPASPEVRARLDKERRDQAAMRELRKIAVDKLTGALSVRLADVRGLSALPAAEIISPDAVLHVTIDRVGSHTGPSREIWLRAVGRLESVRSGESAGPFYAVGQAVSPKWLIKPGYVWPDSDLMAEAARQASRQLVHSLRTGREALFVRAARVAILPAATPAVAQKVSAGGASTVNAGDVQRQADVLFQPGLTPVVDRFSHDEVETAMRRLGIRAADLWDTAGNPSITKSCSVGRALGADYLFVSRIPEMSLERGPAYILQMGVTRPGEEIVAEGEVAGALIRCADSRILWQDKTMGVSAARTQFTKRGPRIRKEDQCLSDAARVGYSWLRSSFENYKRQFEK